MNKEYLEALEMLKTALHNEWLRFYPQFKEWDEKTKIVDRVRMVSSDADAFLIVRQALQRLELIDNANFSEALKCLDDLSHFDVVVGKTKKYDISTTVGNYFRREITTIKQALLKAQEQEKVLEIIKEYQVDVWLLKQCDYENYIRIRKEAMVSVGQIVNENGIILEDEITKEYFELVKRWVE